MQLKNNDINTEDRVLDAAYYIFLLYGFHGTTLQKIANEAGVNKATIHYYFRSKEKLYGIVVELIIGLILNAEFDFASNREKVEKPIWFLYTELYNNRDIFERTIKKLYPNDWLKKITDLNNWLEFSNSPLTNPFRFCKKK